MSAIRVRFLIAALGVAAVQNPTPVESLARFGIRPNSVARPEIFIHWQRF
jgi:hypothetical protein